MSTVSFAWQRQIRFNPFIYLSDCFLNVMKWTIQCKRKVLHFYGNWETQWEGTLSELLKCFNTKSCSKVQPVFTLKATIKLRMNAWASRLKKSFIQKLWLALYSLDWSSVLTILHIKVTTSSNLITCTDVECEANSNDSQKVTVTEFKSPAAILLFLPLHSVTFNIFLGLFVGGLTHSFSSLQRKCKTAWGF